MMITARNVICRACEPAVGNVGNVYRRSPGGCHIRIGEDPVALAEGKCLGSWNNVTSYYVGRYEVTAVIYKGVSLRSIRLRHIAAT